MWPASLRSVLGYAGSRGERLVLASMVKLDQPALAEGELRWRHETRSGWLRLVVLVILVANVALGEHDGNHLVHRNVLVGYAFVSVVALALALTKRTPHWSGAIFVVGDASVVVALLHEHLFGSSGNLDHNLTTSSLAIAFLLLNHVALRLAWPLIVLFATLVVAGWLSLVAVSMFAHQQGALADAHAFSSMLTEAALAAAFSFAAFVSFTLVRDHDEIVALAASSERRRYSLSRFFSPGVVADLQSGGASLDLARREAAVLFVDLRSFTRFAESAKASELAKLLTDYRREVTRVVFDCGGSVDKFIGDGVMAVFGQPQPRPDDAERALRCALRLSAALAAWNERREREGLQALDAGIGLHFGAAVGGVIDSGGHDEFTVFGDAVNVAERLERLTKTLGASLVVSAATLAKVGAAAYVDPWCWRDDVKLEGRSGTLRIAYLPRPAEGG